LGLGLTAGLGAALAACGPSTPAPAPSPTPLPLLSRAAWGAAEPDHTASAEYGLFDPLTNPGGWLVYDQPLSDVLRTLIVHHSALPLSDGPLEIQALHMQRRGYADIGYHYVIDAAGLLYAGRDLGVRGAHTGGANTGSVGACLLGNFETTTPPAPQLDTLRALAADLAARYGLTHLAGHRDFQPDETVCPGAQLEPLLPALAAALGLSSGTGGYVPPPWSQ
jgi:hypothetical protein